jgi:tetratricopeptide (TPR) repeat protein
MLSNQTIDPTRQHSPDNRHVLIRPFVKAWHWLFPPSVADRDRQSPLARYVALALIVSFCVTLLLVGILYAKPIQDSWQSSQAERMVKEARDMMENGQIANAVFKAQEAYSEAPHNVEAIRLNAEFFTLMKREHALFFSDKLKDLGAETLEDKMRRVKALKNLNREKDATKELERLLREEPPSPALTKLAEEVFGKKQQNTALLGIMRSYSEKNPEDMDSLLRLARVQVESGIPSQFNDGINSAWKIAQSDEPIGLKALEFLDSIQSMPSEISIPLLKRLKEHPKADERHYVAALRREVLLYPDRKKAIIDSAITAFKDKRREKLVPFIRWLVEEQQWLEIVTLLPEDEAKTHQGLLENYLTALTVLKRFDQIQRLIEDEAVAKILDHTTHAMFRAHMAFVMNKPPEELRSLLITAKTMAESEGRLPVLQRIAEYADARGHFDIAEDSYRLTIRIARRNASAMSPRIERESLIGLLSASLKNGNSESYFQAAHDAVLRFPEDSEFLDKALYISLLKGDEVETSLRKAMKLLQNQPKDNHRKLMVALGYLRIQDNKQALNYLQYMDLNLLSEGQRAVFAYIASSGGFQDEANGVIRAIDPKARMFPEERRLYNRTIH